MKNKIVYFCNNCGYETPKWMGKCPGCGDWDTMTEEREPAKESVKYTKSFVRKPEKLDDVAFLKEERFKTNIFELDRVLGGGIVKGSLVLVGGDPGIGKSTLLLQMCQTVDKSVKILYVSGEESSRQIKMRAQRLSVDTDNLLVLSETEQGNIIEAINQTNPDVVIIDSVQTVYDSGLSSAAGSVSQIREVTQSFMRLAKESETSILLVGHVTKEGAIAGPRVLEHMVDCVLYFEGERHQHYRILRAVKNRFGSTNEIGVFEMSDEGLKEVLNPSEMLLSGRPSNTSGSCVICTLEGTRPILAEVQALVTRSNFPTPRRMSTGIDYNRVSLLLAVLEKRMGYNLSSQDAYVNVIGGIRVDEPAADLGVALAAASSYKGFSIGKDVLAFGEVGLTGEVRAVNNIEKRIAEGIKLGFKTIILPKGNKIKNTFSDNATIHKVASLHEVLNIFDKSYKK